MSPASQWPRQQYPSAYFHVAYPRWVRCLRRLVSAVSRGVYYFERRTARFYDPITGKEVPQQKVPL